MIVILSSFTAFAGAVFLAALLMNLTRKNTSLVTLYVIQSLTVAAALITLASVNGSIGLLYAGLLTLAVKVAMAPAFLWRMIRKYSAHFSAASYLSVPLSLIALAAITVFSYSFIASRISNFSANASVPLLLASIFIAFFLMVNRRGALAQVIGVLALENGVVLLASLLGVEHSFALELAIAFDIAVWIAIASTFLTMMYRQFGVVEHATLTMTHLREE